MRTSAHTSYRATLADTWAAIGSWLIIALIAGGTGGIGIILRGLGQFFTADISGLTTTHYPYELMLPAVLGAITIAVPLIFTISWLADKLYGKATLSSLQRRTMGLRKIDGATVAIFKVTVVSDVIEELFARGFLLGLLTIPLGMLIGETAAFYVLIVCNTLPYVVRLHYMHHDERRQHPLSQLAPQFMAMIILAVIFVQFGLVASVLVHLLYNLLLVSTDRFTAGTRRGTSRVLIASSLLIVIGLGGYLASGQSWELLLHLPYASFFEYLWASMFFSGVLLLILELLLYDPEPLNVSIVHKVPAGPSVSEAIFKGHYQLKTDEIKPTTMQLFSGEIANAFLATGGTCLCVLLVNFVATFWPLPPNYWFTAVASLAVPLYIFGSRSVSFNGTARLVWENGPILLLVISAFPVIGFWPAASIALARELVCRLIRRPIRYIET
jgi:hypothetical protein